MIPKTLQAGERTNAVASQQLNLTRAKKTLIEIPLGYSQGLVHLSIWPRYLVLDYQGLAEAKPVTW